ncbi:hypothetical protein BCR42DRAFT_311861, partial [Absidia repens]
MIQVCVMPGPVTPKDDGFWSFLEPLIEQIKTLATRGMDVHCSDGVIVHSKVRLMIATGDIVGLSVLCNHSGHMSKFGCRICLVEGISNGSNRGMYFEPTATNLSMPWRSHDSFLTGDRMQGLKKPSPLAELTGFVGPTSFGLDEMHMLGLGISRQLLSLLDGGKGSKKNHTRGDLYIGEKVAKIFFAMMEDSRSTIPAVFKGSFRQPYSTFTTRAVDYIDIVRYIIPSLFVPAYSNRSAMDALLSLVMIIQIAIQPVISNDLLDQMQDSLNTWNSFLMDQCNGEKLSINVFVPNQHYLNHLPLMIKKLGPPIGFSTRCLERTIGVYKSRLRSKRDPGVEAGNVMVEL